MAGRQTTINMGPARTPKIMLREGGRVKERGAQMWFSRLNGEKGLLFRDMCVWFPTSRIRSEQKEGAFNSEVGGGCHNLLYIYKTYASASP